MAKKRAFVSYAHEDAEFAQRLVSALNAAGVELFFDQWDIQIGDSIIKKIFDEGLNDCQLFIVILSEASVASTWVRNELDVATVQRIEGLTRVVPVLKEDCEIPLSLRALRWLDMRSDFETGIRELTKLAYDVSDRPRKGRIPEFIGKLLQQEGVGGLSREASLVGATLLQMADVDSGSEPQVRGEEVATATQLSPEEVNDAVDELEEFRLVKLINWLGTAPYDFGVAMPTYLLFIHFKQVLDYDPEDDVNVVLNSIAALRTSDAKTLANTTSLSPGRLNRAVAYIDDYRLADVVRHMGTAPFTFGRIRSTRHTRGAAKREAV